LARSHGLELDPQLAADLPPAEPVVSDQVPVLPSTMLPPGGTTFVPFTDHTGAQRYALPTTLNADIVELMARCVVAVVATMGVSYVHWGFCWLQGGFFPASRR
jgi:hypothetical protein